MSARPPATPFDVEVFPELDEAWPADGLGPVAQLAAQLPEPTDLPAGAVLILRAAPAPAATLFARVFRRVTKRAHVATRCTALLARGFTGIGAGLDPATREELVWGIANVDRDLTGRAG